MKLKRLSQLCVGMRGWCMLNLPCSETWYHATVASVYIAVLLWKLRKSWGCFWTTPWAFWNTTGLGIRSLGRGICSSVKYWAIGWTLMVGRHYKWPAGYCFLQNPAVDSNIGQAVYGMKFSSKCEHGHTPYHAMDSKERGSRHSGHQLCILMHDGLRGQVCHSM